MYDSVQIIKTYPALLTIPDKQTSSRFRKCSLSFTIISRMRIVSAFHQHCVIQMTERGRQTPDMFMVDHHWDAVQMMTGGASGTHFV
mmetsp:Transcript_7311/g.14652  ORF Transcript_7311/g.14652 Transcript_7311/m.14652 type:complete len:87 (-) Transcript_7311:99-359(-)